MWKQATVVMVVAGVMLSCTVWNKPASGWSGVTGGEKLEQLFWDDIKKKDFRSLELHLSSTFVGSGPSGPMDRATFLQQVHAYQLTSVLLSECVSHLNGEDVMITCNVQRDGAPAGRTSTLSVWQQYQKGWVMVAHSETPLSQ
jgi:hypothetical protein